MLILGGRNWIQDFLSYSTFQRQLFHLFEVSFQFHTVISLFQYLFLFHLMLTCLPYFFKCCLNIKNRFLCYKKTNKTTQHLWIITTRLLFAFLVSNLRSDLLRTLTAFSWKWIQKCISYFGVITLNLVQVCTHTCNGLQGKIIFQFVLIFLFSLTVKWKICSVSLTSARWHPYPQTWNQTAQGTHQAGSQIITQVSHDTILTHKVKMQYGYFRVHVEYFLLHWKFL